MIKSKSRKNKKGISVIISYILLVSFDIIMGAIVYQWMKTYVPKDTLNCPDEVSIFIKDASFDCPTNTLTLELQNNGRFNVDGYFIHATTASDQELATMDLSSFFDKNSTSEGTIVSNEIVFGSHEQNSFKPNSEDVTHAFNLNNRIYSIEVIPVRYQEDENNRERVVSCGNSRVSESITCN